MMKKKRVERFELSRVCYLNNVEDLDLGLVDFANQKPNDWRVL